MLGGKNDYMMKIVKFILIVSSLISCSSSGARGSKVIDDFDDIAVRLSKVIIETPTDSTINFIIERMSDDGSYTDLDYSSTVSTKWPAQYHMYRLFTLASAFANPLCKYYEEADIAVFIIKGLESWVKLSPQSNNWWYSTILVPQKIGGILILLKVKGVAISEDLNKQMLNIMANAAQNLNDYSDANKADVALHWIYRGCLEHDESTFTAGVNCIYDLLEIGETGFQKDGAFFHDGPQLFIGGYCTTAIMGIMNTAVALSGTQYALPMNKIEALRKYFLDIFPSCVRGGVLNYDAVGRAISEEDYLKVNVDLTMDYYDKMIIVDPDQASSYVETKSSIIENRYKKSSHHHFYRGDYTVHNRPNYNFHVRMHSLRTYKCEESKTENIKGYFLCEGNTGIVQTGQEYYNIMPSWDWNFLPGTTTPILGEIPTPKDRWGTYGTSDFSGGVSDSIYGVSVYKQYDEWAGINTGANKGYFFFDDEIVCLGANVISDSPVVTTLDQCRGKANFSIIKDNEEVFHEYNLGDKVVGDISCVVHNNIGYYIPIREVPVSCELLSKTGNWKYINTNQKDSLFNERVFLLQIGGGTIETTPKSYAYTIVPGMNTTNMLKYINKQNIEIIENSERIQAVRNKAINVWECIFYSPSSFSHDGLCIAADKPCTLIYKYSEDGTPILHLADPSQKGEPISITIIDNHKGKQFVANSDKDNDLFKNGGTIVPELKEQTNGILSSKWNSLQTPLAIYDLNGRMLTTINDNMSIKGLMLGNGVYILKNKGKNGRKVVVK